MGNLQIRDEWLELPFTQFPKIIDAMTEVTGAEKTILRAIFGRVMNAGGGACFPSQKKIAADSGTSERLVSSALKKWKELGFIEYSHGDNGYHYRFKSIPNWVIEKYGVNMDLTEKKKKAEEVMRESKLDAKNAMQKRLEHARKRITDRAFEKPVKEKKEHKDNEVMQIVKIYQTNFDKIFNSQTLNHEKRLQIKMTVKELGQIKTFIAAYGVPAFAKIIEDVFRRWDYFKSMWKVQTDYPTIGILITYGKGQLVSTLKDMVEQIPEKPIDENAKQVKVRRVGW